MTLSSISSDRVTCPERQPSLTINALSNWAALAVIVLVGFFLTPYVISHLGKTGYGIWTLIGSIIGYYGLLDLGVSSAVTRYVARYAGQKNYKALNQTVSAALAMFCVVGLLTVGASFAVAGPLASFFNMPADQVDKFLRVVWILGLAAGLGFPGNLFGAVIRAHERFVAANCIVVVTTLMRGGLIVLFLSRGIGLVGVAWANLVTAAAVIVLNYALCKWLFSHLRFRLAGVRWHALGTLLSFGAATTVMAAAGIMRFQLDSFVIGKWIGLKEVAVYGVAALLIRYMLRFIATGTQAVLTPRFAALDGEEKREQLQQLFLKSLSVAAFLSFAVGTLVIVFGRQFIILWVGSEFIGSAPVLCLLAVCYAVALAQVPGISAMYALKKHHYFAGVSVAEGIANVGLSIYLAPRYGIVGVAMGTAAPMLVIKLFVQPMYVSRILGVSFTSYWSRLAPGLALAIGLVLLGRHVLQIRSFGRGYISLVLSGLPILGAFAFLYVIRQMIAPRRSGLEPRRSV